MFIYCQKCIGFWEIRYQLAKVERALMGASWPQVSFLKDGQEWSLLPLSHLILSLITVTASWSQVLPVYSGMTLSSYTFFLQLCHMSNPLAFKQQWSLISVCLSWIWTTITSPFIQWKVLACLLQNLPNSLAFMVFWDSQKTKQLNKHFCLHIFSLECAGAPNGLCVLADLLIWLCHQDLVVP